MDNKQQTAMKLYTEEQVVRAIELSDGRSTDEVLAGLTPIELPSDEEIDYAETQMPMNTFELGAKWMRNKIQGGKR
jgi:hypothetical protein